MDLKTKQIQYQKLGSDYKSASAQIREILCNFTKITMRASSNPADILDEKCIIHWSLPIVQKKFNMFGSCGSELNIKPNSYFSSIPMKASQYSRRIAKYNRGASVSQTVAYKFEVGIISTAFNAAISWMQMVQSTSINSDSCWVDSSPVIHDQLLKTQRLWGKWPDDESLAMITINPAASNLEISELWVGIKLKKGKQGDWLIFWYTSPFLVFIQSLKWLSWWRGKYFDIKEIRMIQRLTISPTEMVEGCFTSDSKLSGANAGIEHLFEMAGTYFNQNLIHPEKTEDMNKTNKNLFSPSWISR